jgi:LmbE family N-acetylglucosaminyl deacetylase
MKLDYCAYVIRNVWMFEIGATMTSKLKLMAVLAHPDDESLGLGGVLAKYSSQNIDIFLVTATRGQRGRYGDLPQKPSLEEIGRMREKELRAAAIKLGVRDVELLDYVDGDLDQADPKIVIAEIVRSIRKHKPDIIVTFGPEGVYGHPDHIAISQFATAAAVASADPDY